MARRVSWTNNSSGHSGAYVYRAPTLDPQNLPAPVATVDPVAQGETAEWIDSEALDGGDYDYAVQDFDGVGVGALSAVATHTVPLVAPSIGDYWLGGLYAGIDTIGGADYHIIVGKEDSAVDGLQWKTSNTSTPGTSSDSDGLANTLAMQSAGLTDHPGAAHCLGYKGGGYEDWHMPARNQLFLFTGVTDNPDFLVYGGYTFSSSEESATKAWSLRVGDNIEGATSKDTEYAQVRPIRRVAV